MTMGKHSHLSRHLLDVKAQHGFNETTQNIYFYKERHSDL